MAAKRKTPSELTTALTGLRGYFGRAFAFHGAAAVLSLAPVFFMMQVYDRVITSRNVDTLWMLVLLMVLVYIVAEVVEWAGAETMRDAGAVLEHQMAVRAFGLVYESRLRTPGSGTTALDDLRTLAAFVAGSQAAALMQLPAAIVAMGLIYWLSPVLFAFALLGLLLQTVLTWLNERATQQRLQQANQHASAAQREAEESLRTAEVVEALGMTAGVTARWAQRRHLAVNLQWQASEAAALYQTAARWVATSTMSLTMALGAMLLIQDALPAGGAAMMVAAILSGKAMGPLLAMITGWRGVVGARDARQRLAEALDETPPKQASMPLPPPRGHLRVETLVATPPGGGPHILRGVAFELQPGQLAVVMGTSGSGKSTLARLLVGLWPATQGKVRLDGVDVHTWHKAELGPHVGYLGQTVDLIEGTVAENIARFGTPDQALLEAAARTVGMHEAILALPQGYDTPVGPDGAFLSGGQRQRVALARALYGQPALVVLDEPNANLDDAGDASLRNALQSLKDRGATVVVVAHRPSVLELADRMLILREGIQQAFGTPQQVLKSIQEALAA